jgi:threonine/homoserine/homoserine lactone efflux protein
MLSNLLIGIGLGFGAGVSPGPLMALVLTRSAEKGFSAGLRISLAPLFSDLPVVILSILLLPSLSPEFLGILALAGGSFVVLLGISTIRGARKASLEPKPKAAGRDLLQAIVVNLANPHPWLFWMTVGGPLTVTAWRSNPAWALAFVIPFYALLVGSKVAVAGLVAKGRRHLTLTWYRRVLHLCGGLLVAVGITLIISFFPVG